MKAKETRVLEFINNAPQFVIPIYQRNYSWTEQQCDQLWNDILRAGNSKEITGHFIGSIVYIEDGLSNVSLKSPLLVIDGQQRLTTLTLLLAALAEALGDDELVEGFSKEKILYYYLLNHLEKGDRRYKLLLSQTDKPSLLHILGAPAPREPSLAITQNFQLFTERLAACPDLTAVCNGLAKLIVVDIALNRDHDNPQLIFESMNSTGLALSQADLIRNYLLMGLDTERQSDLYERYWRPMELSFGQAAYQEHFDGFMRHYLTAKTGDIPRFDQVYAAFKKYAQRESMVKKGVEFLVADLHAYAGYYCNLILGSEPDNALRGAFTDLRELKADVAYPLLLEWYHDYATGLWDKNDFLTATRLVESYVFRRAACAIPTNSLSKTFTGFSRSVNKKRYLESVKATFALLTSYRRFPDDKEFKRELQVRNLYTNRLRSYWPWRMENFDRKEQVMKDGQYSVEHIMPQNKELSAEWRKALGADWQRIHEQWLHTLGNLTLTGYNSEYRDRPFEEKRDTHGGFRESPLRLNAGLGTETVWNEDAIKRRAAKLAKMATKVWTCPALEPEILERYRPKVLPATTGYTLEDYPYLQNPEVRELFEALRREILALDPVVSEEILKLYIAFKAETNFVDVTPQSKRLRLSLNMKYHALTDPRKMCRDITNIGRWGNGDVEVFFSDMEELPYIMSLVQQAFEAQMDGNDQQ